MIVWVDEGKRRVRFVKTEDITFKDVKLWRYRIEPNTFKNSTDPTNALPELAKHYFVVNHPRGMAPRQRVDAFDSFLSKPHFFDGDVQFHKNQLDIDLNPTSDIHDTYLDIEPLTGRTFAARKRLQLGVYLSRVRINDNSFGGVYGNLVAGYPGNSGAVEAITATANGKAENNLYIPIFWGSEGKDIDDDAAASFVSNIYGTRKTFFVTQIVLVIFGGVMFFTFLILCVKARQASTSTSV
jgi:hypothetical protein